MQADLSLPIYQKSRKAYTVQCTVEYFVSLLVTDTFLAKLLTNIGVEDWLVGIISSFVSLAFIFQLLSLLFSSSRISKKGTVLIFDTVSMLFFMLLYLIPFLPINETFRQILVTVSIGIAYLCKYAVSNILFQWANGYVRAEKRASFSANKETISLIAGILFTLAVGAAFDFFETSGNIGAAFLLIAVLLLILNASSFICLLMVKKDEPQTQSNPQKTFSKIMEKTFGNKNFRRLTVIAVLWDCARYFTIGFLGVFKTNDLGLTILAVQVINTVANLCRMLLSRPFGRYSDRHSFAKGFYLALFLAAGAFLCNVFTTEALWFFIIPYTVLYTVSLAGINQNNFNITYSYVDSEYIAEAMAIKSSIGGICGFLASVVAGNLLSRIQSEGNMFFGIPMYGQQLLSLVSLILCAVCIIYMKKTILKEKVIKQ